MIQQYVSGSSGTLTTIGTLHGVMEYGDWNQPIQTMGVPGVIGVSQLLDYRKERTLSCEFRIHGYASYQNISNALDAADALNQTLTGRVVMSGILDATFDECTYLGFSRGPIKWDGSGNNGWWCEGRLHWVQRAPNS